MMGQIAGRAKKIASCRNVRFFSKARSIRRAQCLVGVLFLYCLGRSGKAIAEISMEQCSLCLLQGIEPAVGVLESSFSAGIFARCW